MNNGIYLVTRYWLLVTISAKRQSSSKREKTDTGNGADSLWKKIKGNVSKERYFLYQARMFAV